jgi:hypothetical protein
MYATENYRTKKALKAAVKAAKDRLSASPVPVLPSALAAAGVPCFQPGPFGPDVADGEHCCEGPHYPEAHKWYARVRVKGGLITRVIS